MTPSEAAQQILQRANAAGLSPKDWADKFNKFNPKPHTQRGLMTFDPNGVTPSAELLRTWHEVDDGTPEGTKTVYTDAARWGARQAVEALRHQWPEPITDRPLTEEDADDLGYVQVFYGNGWSLWEIKVAMEQRATRWLHTYRWRPKPKLTPKQQALALLNEPGARDLGAMLLGKSFTDDQVALLRQVVGSAPDTTP